MGPDRPWDSFGFCFAPNRRFWPHFEPNLMFLDGIGTLVNQDWTWASSVEKRQMSQQQSSVLSQQQPSVLSQQKTPILSQQKTSQLPASGRLLSRLLLRQDR